MSWLISWKLKLKNKNHLIRVVFILYFYMEIMRYICDTFLRQTNCRIKDIKEGMKKIVDEKEIEIMAEKVLKEIKSDVKEKVKLKVKEKLPELKEEVLLELKLELQDGENSKVKNIKTIADSTRLSLMTLSLYIFISFVTLYSVRISFEALDSSNPADIFNVVIFFIIIATIMIISYRVVINFYRLKQNENIRFVYGLYEVTLGMLIILVAICSFIPKASAADFLNTTKIYFYFYGGIYVAVRGLETLKKHFDYAGGKPIVYMADISKERKLEKYINKKINA
ncbi:hypothetical protein [Bacillus toyonensis]|uniref:hypothetical protein n=1 Tax=Bacillus toyonensis TaxID=155322 RepID=UPI0021D33789|nr:hypothetical protein [Bacillus toyonensis]MCU4770867.1 hypothetical protein [Bacillus toyonensis]